MVDRGEKFLRDYSPGPWTPWAEFAVARAHDVKLLFSMPPGEMETGRIYPLNAAEAARERSAAIAGFRTFVAQQPDTADAVFAWQEAWRLLAGLPPSAIGFGCSCE